MQLHRYQQFLRLYLLVALRPHRYVLLLLWADSFLAVPLDRYSFRLAKISAFKIMQTASSEMWFLLFLPFFLHGKLSFSSVIYLVVFLYGLCLLTHFKSTVPLDFGRHSLSIESANLSPNSLLTVYPTFVAPEPYHHSFSIALLLVFISLTQVRPTSHSSFPQTTAFLNRISLPAMPAYCHGP